MSEQNDTCTECKGTGIDSLAIFPNDDPCFACNGTGKESVHQQRKAEWARTYRKTVYVVTEGEYSDYHIEAVFDDRMLAEDYIDRRSLINALAPINGMILYQTIFNADESEPYYVEFADAEDISEFGDQPVVRPWGPPGRLVVMVLARNEAHARKIAQDKRAEYLAAEFGIS